MRRPAAAERQLERIHRWREQCPDLALCSTFIVGFPGETERDFEQLLSFLKAAQLDRVGCFTYSPVEGAVANGFPGAISEGEKADRLDAFMAVQAEISAARLAEKVGRTLEVLVDEIGKDGVIARGPGMRQKSMGWCTCPGWRRALAIGSRWKSSPAMSMT